MLEVAGEKSGVRHRFDVATHPGVVCVDSPLGSVTLTSVPRFVEPTAQLPPGSLLAPMPGTVLRVAVAAGEAVTEGQPLLWLEAMKMEHRIAAPSDGLVTELPVVPGQQVDVGAVLAVVGAVGLSNDTEQGGSSQQADRRCGSGRENPA